MHLHLECENQYLTGGERRKACIDLNARPSLPLVESPPVIMSFKRNRLE